MELDLLKKIVAEVMKVDVKEISLDSTFVDDLGADSLDLYRILMNMQEEFKVVLPKDCINSVNTIGDAYKLLQKRTQGD